MRYLRCKCGHAERWDTGEVIHPCEGCEECNTTFGSHPDDHEALQPHKFEHHVQTVDGVETRSWNQCSVCHAIMKPKANSDLARALDPTVDGRNQDWEPSDAD